MEGDSIYCMYQNQQILKVPRRRFLKSNIIAIQIENPFCEPNKLYSKATRTERDLTMPTEQVIVSVLLPTALALNLLLSTASAQMTCDTGEFLSGEFCKPCPKGTFQRVSNTTKTACTKCPANSYTPFKGVKSKRLCISCPRNAFSSPGTITCTRCPRGRIFVCDKCIRCPPGTSVNNYSCRCDKCDGRSYSTTFNSVYCSGSCTDGFKVNAKRTGCVRKSCPDGLYFDGYECLPCQYNTYRNGSMPLCKECAFNTVTNNFNGPNPRCIRCPPGQFISDYIAQTRTDESVPYCEVCPDNSITKGFGKPFCREKGAACPPNTFEDQEGDCIVCSKGERADPKLKRCIPCSRKSVSGGGVSQVCVACPAKAYRDAFGQCTCRWGYIKVDGKCEQCPAGTVGGRYSNCRDCPPRRFSRQGDETCRKCPAGTTSAEYGSVACKKVLKCPPKFIPGRLLPDSPFTNSHCLSGLTGCPPGLNPVVIRGQNHCAPPKGPPVCPGDEVFDGVNKCLRCYEGGYISKVKGRLRCKNCAGDSFSKSVAAYSCMKCDKGFSEVDFECSCNAGRFINGKGECVPCRNGYFSSESNSVACEKCTNGFTSSRFYHSDCECAPPRVVNSEGKCVRS